MPTRSSPTAAHMELTIRLRARRLELGLPIREVSKHLEFTPNYYSAVENGRTLLAADKLERLCERLELTASETRELIALREQAREPRWTVEFAQLISEDLAVYYGLEHAASRIRSYEGRLMPGLLQSNDYTMALVRDDPDLPGTRVHKRLELRQRRQERLFDPTDPLHLHVLISEAVIMQEIGGRSVLQAQLTHLADTIERLPDTLEVNIVPFASSPRGMVNASTIHLLEFARPHLPVLAWREAITPVGLTSEGDVVDVVEVNFDRALLASLSREDSLALIRKRAEELAQQPSS